MGSILLPDVMRRRREEALARRETQTAEGIDELGEALTWSVEGTREPDGAARHPEWFKNPEHVNPEPDKRPLPTFTR